jgi:hypothetical protein
MIDMSTWSTMSADVVDDLHLDPKNVRLGLEANAPESDIMLDLFKNEKALALVEGIVKVGYLTHELPIVVKRRRRLIIVEGNRRVAALKAVHNPYLVPEFQARISALVDGFDGRDDLRRIEVKVAPNQAAADQLIATLHAGNPRVAWSPARQAAFFQAQIDSGRTLKHLRENYPMIDVDKYVLRSAILGRFRAVRYSRPELTDYVNGRGLSTSTLARIYESKEFIELAGLRLDEGGELACRLSRRTFDAMAELIIEGMEAGDIDTRSVNTVKAPRFQKLMGDLTAVAATSGGPGSPGAPDKAPSGPASGTQKTESSAGSSTTGNGGSDGASPRRRSGPKRFLDVADCVAPDSFPPSVHRILEELATLDVDRYPNAAFDLLRTLLEKTIKSFAEAKSENLKPSGNNGYVYLSNCLDWLEGWFKTHGPRAQVQVVKKVRSNHSRDFSGSQDLQNAINHNHHIFATADDVRTAWDTMKSLIVEMLK